MTIFLWILLGIVTILLLLVTGMRPTQPSRSRFEVKRLADTDDSAAKRDVTRYQTFDDIITVQRIISTLLVVIVIILCVVQLGWVVGVIVAVVVVLEYPVVARLPVITDYGQKIYDRIEPHLIAFVGHFPGVFAVFRARPITLDPPVITSKEELQQSIAAMTGGITSDEKRLVTHSLSFGSRLVSEVMTPQSMIQAVDSKELLGPLALDELHKTGHSRFPVTEGDINHIVGILHIQDLLIVTAKKTPTAAQSMEQKVYYIHESDTLQHALNAFIRTHHHLFIVVNEYRETVGVLTLEDTMETLLGREIIDEFDTHDDLRKVAQRNPHGNNTPTSRTDV